MWDRLTLPLRWRKPAVIFANSTSDMFHESLPMLDIAQIFAVAVAAHHLRGHVTQILTKRADRMNDLLNREEFWEIVNAEASMHVMAGVDPLDRRSDDARATLGDYDVLNPPPGVWLGVSVENQVRADERIPHILMTPAAVRFLSCEPMLGPVNLTSIDLPGGWDEVFPLGQEHLGRAHVDDNGDPMTRVDWVICGGESGRMARPMHPDWARSLRDQCAAAGVPFFFKQWGEFLDIEHIGERWNGMSNAQRGRQQFLYGKAMINVGKKLAGRLIDGVTHDGMPEVSHV